MQFAWRVLTGCDWQESRTELRHYYTSHRKRIWLLLAGALGLVAFVRLLNAIVGRLPAIPNLLQREMFELPAHSEFGFEILLFPALIGVMLLLPPIASYPVDFGRVTLLPRKIWCLLLSVPLAASFGMECEYSPLHYADNWWDYAIAFWLGMATFAVPVAVMASFLNDIKIARAFFIAAGSWVGCRIAIEVISWHRFPMDLSGVPLASTWLWDFLGGYAIFALGSMLLVWHRTRWTAFVAGCYVVVICHLVYWSLYAVICTYFSHAWATGAFWVLNSLSAGATWVLPANYSWIVTTTR